MNIDNGIISKRQAFRIALLENITIGMVIIPYVTTSVCGGRHMWSFLAGIMFICFYGCLVYLFSKWFPEGLVTAVDENMGCMAALLETIYALRYILRAAVILCFFAEVIHRYMLRSMNVWVIAVPFLLVCGYGALRDIEGRGRLMELLFWWMIVPLILLAVFSITNVGWSELPDEMLVYTDVAGNDIGKIFLGGYLVLLSTSGIELMTYTLVKQKENNWKNALKMLVWLIIAILLAYVFVIGILGCEWVSSDDMAALNVMEASAFPGGLVERMDYPVLAFWIIGVFAVASGYMFYAKIFVNKLCGRGRWWQMPAILLLTLVMMGGLSIDSFGRIASYYILWADFAISIIVPVAVYMVKHIKTGCLIVMLCLLLGCTGCQNKYETASLENRDYATEIEITIERDKSYIFVFTVADLAEYSGDSEGLLKTKEYVYVAADLEDAMCVYYDENNRQLDIGHVNSIVMHSSDTARLYELVKEIGDMPMMAKSVEVTLYDKEETKKILLRELIKTAYAWE